MKKNSFLFLFVLLAAGVFGERTPAPPPQPGSSFSFSLTPGTSVPFGSDGSLGGDLSTRQCFGVGWGVTFSSLYRPPPSPLYVGVDLAYSWVPYADWAVSGIDPFKAWFDDPGNRAIIQMSMFQAGLVAGIQLDILPTVGIRGFGSAGHSYNVLGHNAGRGARHSCSRAESCFGRSFPPSAWPRAQRFAISSTCMTIWPSLWAYRTTC